MLLLKDIIHHLLNTRSCVWESSDLVLPLICLFLFPPRPSLLSGFLWWLSILGLSLATCPQLALALHVLRLSSVPCPAACPRFVFGYMSSVCPRAPCPPLVLSPGQHNIAGQGGQVTMTFPSVAHNWRCTQLFERTLPYCREPWTRLWALWRHIQNTNEDDIS